MAEGISADTGSTPRQLRLVALLMVPVLVILAIVYVTLFRTEMAVLASKARPDEAAAIVAELKKQDVAFELRDDGTTILVPSDRAGELRLSLVAGGVATAGSVGFELFNQSDMGLTDFAQKVNYQRALQGELTRTIVAMDGVASARVHLALPERTLFRTNRSEPRAAVTVVPKPGATLDGARIAGIQQLVASAVADLRPDMVTVLNASGQLVSAPLQDDFRATLMKNATALERAYAGRIGDAISRLDPAQRVDVSVLTSPRIMDPAATIPATPADRNHAVRVVIYTPNQLPPEREAEMSSTIASAIGATAAAGDDIRFSLRPVADAPASTIKETPATASMSAEKEQTRIEFGDVWIWLSALAGVLGVVGVTAYSLRHRKLARRDRLVAGLREQLRLEQVG